MKLLLLAFIAPLALLAQLAGARGLKAPREAADAAVVLTKQLQVDNEALKRRNQQLEAMMQMARSEVQRMDAASHSRKHGDCGGEAEVFKQEIQDLKKKLSVSEADKQDLVQTLRRMLSKNNAQIFQKQAEREQQRTAEKQAENMALEVKSGNEERALEAQIKLAEGKRDEAKELAASLQEESFNLQTQLHNSKAVLTKSLQKSKELGSDKANLVTTMQALMRENTRFKHALQEGTDNEKKSLKELAAVKAMLSADEAMLAVAKKGAAVKAKEQVQKKGLKAMHMHHKHQGMTAAQKAHMHEIDNYIDRTDEELDDSAELSDQQMSAVQKVDTLVKTGKVGAHLSDWLDVKPPQVPKPVPATKAVAATKSKPVAATRSVPATKPVVAAKVSSRDDGESEAADLVAQAKAQLAAMQKASLIDIGQI